MSQIIPHFTPEILARSNNKYNIPIYQRLFEWEEDQIKQLLEDLTYAFNKDRSKSYYIGMLTAKEPDKDSDPFDLVDGQQRFTVMTLLGLVFRDVANDTAWNKFLRVDGNKVQRLTFSSRPSDSKYLNHVINTEKNPEHIDGNEKMKTGLSVIKQYLEENLKRDEVSEFSKFVFSHLVFFISCLPKKYNGPKLNIYFERMGSAGVNLKPFEKLKVDMLKVLDTEDKLKYQNAWSLVENTDYYIYKAIKDSQSKDQKVYETYIKEEVKKLSKELLQHDSNGIFFDRCARVYKNDDEIEGKSISEILAEDPNSKTMSDGLENNNNEGEAEGNFPIYFPDLLLLTLYWCNEEFGWNENISVLDFFKRDNLTDTFNKCFFKESDTDLKTKVKSFIEHLFAFRFIMDIWFFRSQENQDYVCFPYVPDGEKEKCECMMKYESMLYVYSNEMTNYKNWFEPLIEIVYKKKTTNPYAVFKALRKKDSESHSILEDGHPTYTDNERYWFWRLDFELWWRRNIVFKKEDNSDYQKVANSYIFRRNRSIEHIAPQTPQADSDVIWDVDEQGNVKDVYGDSNVNLRDCFGNLCMISNSVNSALHNSSYNMKKAYVVDHINDKNGYKSIESLKLLYVHQEFGGHNPWTKDAIRKHGNEIYKKFIQWIDEEDVEK